MPLPLELEEPMLSKSKAGQESNPLVDGTSEVLECKGVKVDAAGVCIG